MNTQEMKLRTKLGATFAALVLACAVLGAFAVWQLGKVNANTENIATNALPSVRVLGLTRNAANQIRRLEADMLLAQDDQELASLEAAMDKPLKAFAEYQKTFEALIVVPEEKAAYATFVQHRDAYLGADAKLRTLLRSGDEAAEAKRLHHHESRAAFNAMTATLGTLVDINANGADAVLATGRATYAAARSWIVGIVLGAVAFAGVVGFAVVRSVTRRLGGEPGEAAALACSVATGDLSRRVALRPGDDTSLMAQLQQMQNSLGEVVAAVRGNADNVATASAEIAQGNTDLSQRTEQQAAALEQTAASMEEFGATVRQNADNAKQANQLAMSASEVAITGGEVVGQVVQTMKGINDSSKRIADIIGVIDGIAFQTNILALNAAVEAARAGEQGRGFAVVASEVRSLAQRSAGAAKEIKGLINASVERVEQGSALVDRAGATMTEVVASIRRVTDIMGEISAASTEQSAGVAQVGEAVAQMDQATQQNAALVEEGAAAAESLRDQAQQLVQTVAVFKLSAGAAAAGTTH